MREIYLLFGDDKPIPCHDASFPFFSDTGLRAGLPASARIQPWYEISLTPAEATIDLVGGSATLRVLVASGEVIVQKGVPRAGFLNGLIFLRENPGRR